MGEASLDDLMSMNEHLTALVAAGVPLDIGISPRNLPATLAHFNASIARRVSRGVARSLDLRTRRARIGCRR